MADAAYAILSTQAGELSGQCLLDEDFLRGQGVEDFSYYAVDSEAEIYPDLFVD